MLLTMVCGNALAWHNYTCVDGSGPELKLHCFFDHDADDFNSAANLYDACRLGDDGSEVDIATGFRHSFTEQPANHAWGLDAATAGCSVGTWIFTSIQDARGEFQSLVEHHPAYATLHLSLPRPGCGPYQ
jgi:hypothetical protein